MPDPPNGHSQGGEGFTLSTKYTSTSGNEPFTITTPLDPPSSNAPSTESRTTYLHGLRVTILSTQAQVNKELTARMEQDNLKAQQSANGINDSKEEENYGEEVQEEEE